MANIWLNKRRSERVPCSFPVSWIRQGRRCPVLTGDLGAQGMFLRTTETTDPGSLMQLEVELPDGGPTAVMFVFARFVGQTACGQGIGVEHYVVSERDRRRWANYYRSQLDLWHAREQPQADAR